MTAVEEGKAAPAERRLGLGSHGFPLDGTDDDKLAWAVQYAILAPSSHNSQPWRFHVADGVLELRADRTRALAVVDPRDRELVISCGAALFHVRVALRKVGETAQVDVLPDPADPDLLARVTLGACCETVLLDKWLFWAMRTRRTNRRRFADKLPPAELLAELEASAAAEGAALRILPGDEDRKRLARLVAAADRVQSGDKDFRHELASWLRSNRRLAADGMPGSAFGQSNVTSAVRPLVVRTFDWGRGRAAHDAQLALGSPVLAVLTTEGDAPADWLAAGQALAHVLLRATAEDVVGSFLNQPVEVEELRPELAPLAGGGTPQLVLRLGYAKQVPPTPRRPLVDVLS